MWRIARHEKRLVKRSREGDLLAFKELINRHFDELFHLVLMSIKEPETAKVLVEDICVKVWRQRKTLNSHKPFSQFLNQSAEQAVFACLKKVSKSERLQREVWLSIRATQGSHEKPEFEPAYRSVIKSIQNGFLQRQLLYKLTTVQG